MALLEDTFGSTLSGWGSGLVVGLGALFVAPALVSGIGSVLHPIARTLVKGGMAATEGLRGIIAETSEHVTDLVAEGKAERR